MTSNSGTTIHRDPPTLANRLRRRFIAGLLVVIPFIAAVWAIGIIFSIAESYFGPSVRAILELVVDPNGEYRFLIGPSVRIISLLIAGGFIVAIGWMSTFLAVRKVILLGESLVHKIPIVKFFYTTPKEVMNTLSATSGTSYNRVVMFEYPSPGVLALGFATGDLGGLPGRPHMVSVFMPTTPNPTTGFLMYVPVDRVFDTNLDFEAAIRVIMSGGILTAGDIETRPFDLSKPIETKPSTTPDRKEELAATGPQF